LVFLLAVLLQMSFSYALENKITTSAVGDSWFNSVVNFFKGLFGKDTKGGDVDPNANNPCVSCINSGKKYCTTETEFGQCSNDVMFLSACNVNVNQLISVKEQCPGYVATVLCSSYLAQADCSASLNCIYSGDGQCENLNYVANAGDCQYLSTTDCAKINKCSVSGSSCIAKPVTPATVLCSSYLAQADCSASLNCIYSGDGQCENLNYVANAGVELDNTQTLLQNKLLVVSILFNNETSEILAFKYEFVNFSGVGKYIPAINYHIPGNVNQISYKVFVLNSFSDLTSLLESRVDQVYITTAAIN